MPEGVIFRKFDFETSDLEFEVSNSRKCSCNNVTLTRSCNNITLTLLLSVSAGGITLSQLLTAHNFVWHKCFLSFIISQLWRSTELKLSQVCYFMHKYVEIHQVRRQVFDNYQKGVGGRANLRYSCTVEEAWMSDVILRGSWITPETGLNKLQNRRVVWPLT